MTSRNCQEKREKPHDFCILGKINANILLENCGYKLIEWEGEKVAID